MSAFGGKADVNQDVPECPLIAKSGSTRPKTRGRDVSGSQLAAARFLIRIKKESAGAEAEICRAAYLIPASA